MFCYELCKIWRALFKFVSSVFSLSILKVVQQGPHMCNNSIPMFWILFPNLAWFVSIPTAKRTSGSLYLFKLHENRLSQTPSFYDCVILWILILFMYIFTAKAWRSFMLMLGGKQPKTGFPRRLRCMINTLHKGKTLKDLPPRFQI